MTPDELESAIRPLAHGPFGQAPKAVGRLPDDITGVTLGFCEPRDLRPGEVALAYAPDLGPALALGDALFAHPEALCAQLCKGLGMDGAVAVGPRARSQLRKLAVFVPESHCAAVRDAIAAQGAGFIGDYRDCTFAAPGTGTFTPLSGTHPFIGQEGKLAEVAEMRLESVYPAYREAAILDALRRSHPYEEVAYDLYDLRSPEPTYGSARLGELFASSVDELGQKVRLAIGANEMLYRVPKAPRPIRQALCLSAAADAAALWETDPDAVIGPPLAPWDAAHILERGATLVEVLDLDACALRLFAQRLGAALPLKVRLTPEGLTWRRYGSQDATGPS